MEFSILFVQLRKGNDFLCNLHHFLEMQAGKLMLLEWESGITLFFCVRQA